ncbi:hypothetical protein [Roseibium album]|uniref:hypothetical protein n=1 Tax=Roseibium album TaxID=311410 RepID=UPI0024938694|nr:hypothetical protein [Roseibium album]
MRDIEGIDEAMEVLKPQWSEIEADFAQQNERYLAMAKTDHLTVGRVLRAHLIVENFMNSFLADFFEFEELDSLRLTFAQKAKMLPSRNSSAAFVRPGIIQLNAVRNKYAHRLDHTVEFPAIASIMDVLSVSRSSIGFSDPIDAIEAFAPVACAFLGVPPKHIQDLFIEAFSNVHSMTPLEE